MKLLRLLLQAFGPFTNKAVDFFSDQNNLHLIYGPNEAGKSSALRAMTDLRFGIPVRSPDAFVHTAGDLRIGGVFLTQAGQRIGLVRRKGRGATLARLNTDTEQPDPSLAVDSTHERELTGGLERNEFEVMFGLNHARLREGGKLLLAGEGDLGSALFEASAGTRGITALLAALDADAKKLYSPHGRAQNAVINEARRQLVEQRQAWRQAQTKPADWQAMNRAHETAKAALDDVTKALATLRRRENELTELRTVEPLLREHDRLAAELQSLAEIPDLAENAREERLAAEQAMAHAQQSLREAESELHRCSTASTALVLEPLVLEHADAIDRLVSGVAAAAHHRTEVQQQVAVIEQMTSSIEMLVGRIAPGQQLGELLRSVPSGADRVMLDTHLAQVSRLEDRLQEYRQRAETLDEAMQAEPEVVPVLADHSARKALTASIRHAQSLGDVTRQKTDFDRQIRELEGQLELALSDLLTESEQALRRTHPILDAQITLTKREMSEVDEQLRTARDEYQLVGRDLDEQRLRHRQLAAEGEVVTSETLRLARVRRDEGWAFIRQAYIEHTKDAELLAHSFDPDRKLPDAFEAAESEADRQADLLRADAKRAAGFEECAMRIEQMETRRRELERQMEALASRREVVETAWGQRLSQAGLPSLDPETLPEWQRHRHTALQLAERVASLHSDRERLLTQAAEAAASIAEVIRTLGQPFEVNSVRDAHKLPLLMEQGVRWEKCFVQLEADHNARAKAAKLQRVERDKLDHLISEGKLELEHHLSALQEWHIRLVLPASSTPAAVKARLNELDELVRQGSALTGAQQRKAHLQAVVDDLINQANEVAALLGESAPTALDNFVNHMRKRLVVSREREQERAILTRDQNRAKEKKRLAELEQSAQEAVYTRLCTAAHVATIDRLPELEEAASRKRQAQRNLALLQDQLARASSHSEEEIRTRLAGHDAFSLDSERDQCRAEIERREQDQSSARQTEEQARLVLETIDTSDQAAIAREAMESAAARYRSAIRPWARLKLAHALLQEALNRFREQAQAPMVSSASSYFALMTGGAYDRLVTDESEDKSVLCAQRAGGSRIGIEEMSEGTADQLYLALRLAALELRRSSHPQMPLILDDALITSDDERAANILRALAQFAEHGQVMIFTHHRHLIDLACTALGAQGFSSHSL